jgi:hypothetical protein
MCSKNITLSITKCWATSHIKYTTLTASFAPVGVLYVPLQTFAVNQVLGHILDQKFAYICKRFRKKHACGVPRISKNSEYTSWNTLRSIILSYVRCKIKATNKMSANDASQAPTVKQDPPQSWYKFNTSERQLRVRMRFATARHVFGPQI